MPLKQPCRFCAQLTEGEECLECARHRELYGHYPKEVRWQKVPGQPRAVTRICGECERELLISS